MPTDNSVPDSIRIKTLHEFLKRFQDLTLKFSHNSNQEVIAYQVRETSSIRQDVVIGTLYFNSRIKEISHFTPSGSLTWEKSRQLSQFVTFPK